MVNYPQTNKHDLGLNHSNQQVKEKKNVQSNKPTRTPKKRTKPVLAAEPTTKRRLFVEGKQTSSSRGRRRGGPSVKPILKTMTPTSTPVEKETVRSTKPASKHATTNVTPTTPSANEATQSAVSTTQPTQSNEATQSAVSTTQPSPSSFASFSIRCINALVYAIGLILIQLTILFLKCHKMVKARCTLYAKCSRLVSSLSLVRIVAQALALIAADLTAITFYFVIRVGEYYVFTEGGPSLMDSIHTTMVQLEHVAMERAEAFGVSSSFVKRLASSLLRT